MLQALVMYYSRTGNTKRIGADLPAALVAISGRRVPPLGDSALLDAVRRCH